MLFGTFLGLLAAMYFDIPVLPVLILGALVQTGVAYSLTKNAVCINLGVAVLLVAASHFAVLPILREAAANAGAADAIFVSPPVSNAVTWLAAIIGLAGATLIGMVGPSGASEPRSGLRERT